MSRQAKTGPPTGRASAQGTTETVGGRL